MRVASWIVIVYQLSHQLAWTYAFVLKLNFVVCLK